MAILTQMRENLACVDVLQPSWGDAETRAGQFYISFDFWDDPTEFVFEIDNGEAERTLRKPAIGRKNFLFTGSAPAGQRLAGAYSLVQSCRALNIPTRDYLIDVITKLEAGWPARRLTDLLPHRWSPDLHL